MKSIQQNNNLLFLWISILLCLSGCNPSKPSKPSNEDNHRIDSLITNCKDSEELTEIIQKYTEDENILGLNQTYLQLGTVQRENGHFIDAIETHRKGIEYAKKLNDTLTLIKHLNNIGTNFRRMGILDEASTYHYKALGFCETYSDTSYTSRKNRVISLNGIGNVQLTLGNYEEAERVFRMALKGEQSLKSELGQAINYANIGAIFENKGLNDSARAYYEQSLLHNRKAHSELGISLCHIHFGQLYEHEEKWDLAIAEYKKAYNLMEKSTDLWHGLECGIALGRIYLNKGNLKQATLYINKSTEIANQLHSLEHLVIVYKLQYQLAEKQGNSKLALDNIRKSQLYADSISTEKTSDHIQNVRVRYERERRQQEIELMKKEYEAERKIRMAVMTTAIALALIASLIIISLWYVNRTRAAKQRLMKQMENTRTQFFTNITHEFRTPLTAILGLSKDIANGHIKEEGELKHAANIITRQGDGLLDLVNQLLDISKIKSQIGNPQWRRGNIVSYVQMIVENYRPIASQKQIELYATSEQTKIETDIVPDYFRKIMRNLLSNALKYTPRQGHIVIELKKSDNHLKILISDTGCGIKPKDLPHIFEPFYTGENHHITASTGVGLSLACQLVHALHGEILVESTEGIGTTFTVILPILHTVGVKPFDFETITDTEQPVEEELPLTDITKETEPPIVLIAEDNNDIAYYIGSQLRNHYQLCYAHHGKEALEKTLQIIPDIIITDLMMPEMDGLTLIQKIRESELVNHIPVIIITAKANEEDRIKGLAAGADAYLCKPFSSDELKIRVTKLLEQRQLLREKYSSSIREGKSLNDPDIKASDREFLNKCIDFIEHSITKERVIDIDVLAQNMYLSPRQLNRKIQALTNDSSTNLINRVKIAKAKQMLCKKPTLNVVEVAMRCGYEDASYFGRIFKQMEGMTPTQYRKGIL